MRGSYLDLSEGLANLANRLPPPSGTLPTPPESGARVLGNGL